ncbi:P-loop containing nucleoside triphosphate hydrolase protein [Westerdykella ornata]|uniref:P-loop containing nucleoside triphosphate hydrolase protein n=1 Tax=Westerdykella ornata TaxID=318751 RepID=A0A6A6JP88_WESOR|nr:P-loop containing nucleoside triphosphate hydrolase protein [Westerdykella ornata]KAF2277718.1 P-loop containing nucleoside triphosphate hydrolase protein [Westerdykella ornata]
METHDNSERSLSVLVLGESNTGKTCFTDMASRCLFTTATKFAYYDPTSSEKRERAIVVDGIRYSLLLADFSTTMPAVEDGDVGWYRKLLKTAYETCQGVVLLFSLTDRSSFDKITKQDYLSIILARKRITEPSLRVPHQLRYPAGQQRFGCILVGNKLDLAKDGREVAKEVAQAWADSQGIDYFELDTNKQEPIEEAIRALIRSIQRAQRWDAQDLEEELEKMKQQAAIGSAEKATHPLSTRAGQ